MAPSNMYKRMSLLGVAEYHSSWILLAIALVVDPWLRALPSGRVIIRPLAKW